MIFQSNMLITFPGFFPQTSRSSTEWAASKHFVPCGYCGWNDGLNKMSEKLPVDLFTVSFVKSVDYSILSPFFLNTSAIPLSIHFFCPKDNLPYCHLSFIQITADLTSITCRSWTLQTWHTEVETLPFSTTWVNLVGGGVLC